MADNIVTTETNSQNPFDAFDNATGAESSSLMQGPRRSLGDRFAINFEAAQRYNTLHGALKDTTRPADRMAFDHEYAGFEDWDGFLEGATALTGQLAGTAVAVENFIGLGLGARAIQQLGLTGLRARIFAGAVDAGAANLVVDSGIQGIEMGAGFRKQFDPVQLAASTALGAAIGGAAGPLTHSGHSSDLAGALEQSVDDVELKPKVPIDNAIREPVGDNPSGEEAFVAGLRKTRGVDTELSSVTEAMPPEQRISQAFDVFEREVSDGLGEVDGDVKAMTGKSVDGSSINLVDPDKVADAAGEVEALGDRLAREVGIAPPSSASGEKADISQRIWGSENQQEAFTQLENWKADQAESSLDDLYQTAVRGQEVLGQVGEEVALSLGITFKNPGMKAKEAAAEKMLRKGYATTAELTDVVRGGFVVRSAAQSDEVVTALARTFEIIDEGWNLQLHSGYLDRKLLIRLEDGAIGEVQIWPEQLYEAKFQQGGQDLYTQSRLKGIAKEQREDLLKQQVELYSAALDRSEASFKALSGRSGKSGNLESAQNDLNSSSDISSSTLPESSSNGSNGAQSPPGAATKKATSSPRLRAGRPSQLWNNKTFSGDGPDKDSFIESRPQVGGKEQRTSGGVTSQSSHQADTKQSSSASLSKGSIPYKNSGEQGQRAKGTIERSDSSQRDTSSLSVDNAAIATAKERLTKWKTEQPVRTLDELYELAPQHQTTLQGVGEELAVELGVTFKNPGLKQKDTATEKMVRKAYRGTSELTDVIRGGFVVKTLDQSDEVVRELATRFDVIDEGWQSKPTGYRDRKVMLRFADGSIGEVQIWPEQMYEAKFAGGGQDLYTRSREPQIDPVLRESLEQEEAALYSAAFERMDASWNKIFGKGGTSVKPDTAQSVRQSSSVQPQSTRPESNSKASHGFQSAPGLRTKKPSLYGERHAAGRPSQSNNNTAPLGQGNVGTTYIEKPFSSAEKPTSSNSLGENKGRADGDLTSQRSHQTDTNSSSVSPSDKRITPMDGGVQGPRAKGSTGRPDSLQRDTSSLSPTSDSIATGAKSNKSEVKPRLQGAEGQRARPESGIARSEARANAVPFTRLRDVSNRLADLAGIAAARQKRFSLKGSKSSRIMGTYGVKSGVVRIRSQDDFDTFSHEVGHHIEERLGKPVVTLMQRHFREVEALAYPGVAPENKLTEGFAEFFRLAMTNPRYVEDQAPKFFKEFRRLLQKDDPDLLKGLDEVAEAYNQFLQMPSHQAVESTIVSNKALGTGQKFASEAKRYGLGATIADKLHNVYTALLDDFHPIHRAVRELAKIHKARTGSVLDLKVKDDAGKLADMARGSQQAGHMDLMYGVHGYESLKPESASLRDAIVEAHGPGRNAFSSFDEAVMKTFGAYLWSRRAVFEWERYKKGEIPNPPDKLSLGDHLQNIREAEAQHPYWVSAAEKVYEFVKALWKKKLDAGLIALETYKAGLKIRDYVPGLRAFDYDGDPGTRTSARSGKSSAGSSMGSRHFKGSTRDVINPLESLMADAYETNAAIARNAPIKALAKLARQVGNGAGRIAEIVPAHELKAMIIDPLEALKSAGRSVGMTPDDVALLTDSIEGLLGDSKATIFRPAVTNAKGEPILFYRDGGQIQALRLADSEFGNQLMASFGMLAPVEHHMLIRMMGASASVLRAGITTTPEFILANGARDLMTSFVYYDEPFKVLKNIGKGFADEIFNRQAAKEYNSLGGIMGGANAASVREGALKRDLEALRKKGWKGRRVPSLQSIMEFTELSETGVRVGLMRTFKEKAQARGLSGIEAAYEAVWRARDHINFDRRGSQMVALNRLIPFFNASLQGLDKFSRHMVLPYVKKLQGDVLTAADEAALGTAQKAWMKLSGLVLAGMGLHALMSQHSEYEEISDTTRATHWMVKTGDKWIAVPKPYELAVFINMGEAAYDAFAKGDPLAAERYLSNLSTVLMPPSVMEGNPIVKTYFELKSNQDFFTGQQIVPDHLQALESALQYTARTRAFSKQLGEALDISPLVIEKVFSNFAGGWGRNLAALYDYTDETALGQSPDDAPFLRRFVKDASKGSRSVSKFWDLVSPSTGQFERAALSYRALADGGDDVAADEYLNSLDSERRAYVTLAMMPAAARRLHPLERARSAVRAIGALRRELTGPYITNAFSQEDMRKISAADRGAADDILADLSMAETRNALIALGVPGWAHQKAIDTRTYHSELKELSPVLAKALADRFATRKVLPLGIVLERWPELRKRVLMDGSGAITVDLEASAEAAGYELGGFKIPRKEKPEVKGRR